jgi:hypothetical protein
MSDIVEGEPNEAEKLDVGGSPNGPNHFNSIEEKTEENDKGKNPNELINHQIDSFLTKLFIFNITTRW